MRGVRARSVGPIRIASGARTAALLAATVLLSLLSVGCTGGAIDDSAATAPGAVPAPPPPPPPAACLLDTDALATTTGLSWTADAVTASDTRCVYDPAPAPAPAAASQTGAGGSARDGATEGRRAPSAEDGGPGGPVEAGATGAGPAAFVAVDVTPAAGEAAAGKAAAAQLDVLAQVCEAGTRTATAGSGFVCRLSGGSVFAALVDADRVVTVAASDVPAGTTAAALVVAFGEQLDALG